MIHTVSEQFLFDELDEECLQAIEEANDTDNTVKIVNDAYVDDEDIII